MKEYRGDEFESIPFKKYHFKPLEEGENLAASQEERIAKLESEILSLKNFINHLVEIGPNDDVNFKGWEVMELLRNWAE